jgi:tRNA wybutosine-synthesizing protein 4
VYRIIGGVIRDELLQHSLEILQLRDDKGRFGLRCSEYLNDANDKTPRPLLSGTSVVPLSHGEFAVIGGGATCFSMGTFWNTGVYTFHSSNDRTNGEPSPLDTMVWAHEKTIDIIPGERSVPFRQRPAPNGQSNEQVSISSIPRVKLQTANDFTELLRRGEPAVIEGLDLGSCVSNWTLDYLVDKVGHDRKVGHSHPFITPKH